MCEMVNFNLSNSRGLTTGIRNQGGNPLKKADYPSVLTAAVRNIKPAFAVLKKFVNIAIQNRVQRPETPKDKARKAT